LRTKILKLRRFGLYNYIVLEAPAIARTAKPGQFVEIKVEGEKAPFWRRPFSICRIQAGKVELLIKTVGIGTRLIAQKRVGDLLDVIGPLGRGFSLGGKAPVILVGGGFGVAPLLFLAETLCRRGRSVEILIGGRSKEDLLLRREMKRVGAKLACITEDGSYGTRGLVTMLLQQRLDSISVTPFIAAAGPYPMLRAVAEIARNYSVAAEVSLETVMACGLGVCNGCVVRVAGHYQRVCKDGPVFNAHEIEWGIK